MKPCYFSKEHIIMKWCNRILMPIYLSIMIGAIMILQDYVLSDGIGTLLGFVLVGLFLLCYGLLFELYFTREYELCREGIRIRYARRFIKLYPWHDMTQICLCYIHPAPRRNVWDEVIWCSMGTVRDGPPDPALRWCSEMYGYTHFHSVIQIEFTPERLEEFCRFSPLDISDHRIGFLERRL